MITEKIKPKKDNVLYKTIPFKKSTLKSILQVLLRNKIQSVFVEGGAKTLQRIIDAGFWDIAYVFEGNVIFNKGIQSPNIKGTIVKELKIKDNDLRVYKNDRV